MCKKVLLNFNLFFKIHPSMISFQKRIITLLSFMLMVLSGFAQQECDKDFDVQLQPRHQKIKTNKTVYIDEAHYNFHTMDGRYCGFTKLLRRLGLKVEANHQKFSAEGLEKKEFIVISNAADSITALLHEADAPWVLPNRSAFSTSEIKKLNEWVYEGGSLLLISDHMPFPGCVNELAKSFGFFFFNGYAEINDRSRWPSQFKKENETLGEHMITNNIDSIATFTGSAFWKPQEAIGIFTFDSDHDVYMVQESGKPYAKDAPKFSAEGLSHGAVLQYGKGKIAVFGEAAMFTSQKIDNNGYFGYNHDKAPHNIDFIVNLLDWLLK